MSTIPTALVDSGCGRRSVTGCYSLVDFEVEFVAHLHPVDDRGAAECLDGSHGIDESGATRRAQPADQVIASGRCECVALAESAHSSAAIVAFSSADWLVHQPMIAPLLSKDSCRLRPSRRLRAARPSRSESDTFHWVVTRRREVRCRCLALAVPGGVVSALWRSALEIHGRIFTAARSQLCRGCGGQIHTAGRSQLDEIYQDVRELVGHPSIQRLSSDQCRGVTRRQPLQHLSHFAHLADQGDQQRFGIVELLPVRARR